MVDAPASRRSHEKTELLPLIFYGKYKIGADVSDQLLPLFSKKVCEMVGILFFHLCNLDLVNGDILCRKGIKQKAILYNFLE
jgi:hypothetical protein